MKLVGDSYVVFDDMTWPRIHGGIDDLERALRYGEPTRADLLTAASVLAAYTALVEKTVADRRRVVAMLRRAERVAAD